MATVTFDKATRQYPGNPTPSVDKLDLDIADGEFLVLVGPSGCGKSTSLRMLAGLEEVNGGRILDVYKRQTAYSSRAYRSPLGRLPRRRCRWRRRQSGRHGQHLSLIHI